MATFEKRAGSWRVKVRKNGASESATFPTKSQAMAWAVAREKELAEVAGGAVPRKTVREALVRYLADESPKKRGLKWETVRISGWLGRINPRTGEASEMELPWLDKQLSELTQNDLATWRDARSKKVSAGSVLREMNLLGAVFSVAVREWKWLRESPLKGISRPANPESRTRRITEREIDALCLALGWDNETIATQTTEVAAAFLLAIETAMRQGELLGLTWGNVDFERRVAHLPMTKNSTRRDVPLSLRALEILKMLSGRHPENVFTVNSANADALFRKAKGRAMIEDLHFHDTRREATSRLSKKVDVLTLARITGHKDLRMLMIYYQTDMSEVAQQIG